MPQFLASKRRKRLGAAGRSAMAVANGLLASAGVYVVHVCADRLEDPAGILSHHHLDGKGGVSLRRALQRLDRAMRSVFLAAMREAKHGGVALCEICTSWGGKDGQWFRVHLNNSGPASAPRWDIVFTDITRDHERIETLRQEVEHLGHIVEYNPQLPWIADANGRLIDFSDRWLRTIGVSPVQGKGLADDWPSICHPDDVERVHQAIADALRTHQPFDVTIRRRAHGEYRWVRARGYPRFDSSGHLMCWYGYSEDVHEKVLIDQQISWDAEHDTLTGLCNRTHFTSALSTALTEATATFSKVALILVDLDNFKDVNDIGGHGAGDELLRKFAEFLSATAPETALVARFGGDEFAVMLEGVESVSEVVFLAERIIGVEREFQYGGRAFTYHASAGIGIFPDHGINANQLLRHVDLALYSAKSSGQGQLQLFEKGMLEDMHERLAMVNRARTAAKGNRIFAYYQPKVCLETGRLAGFEALLRWQDSSGRIHLPASIYAAFDEKGVADMLGKAMINQVLGDIAAWKQNGLPFHSVAINASAAEMRSEAFVDNLFQALDTYGVNNSEIEVEITEGVFLGANAEATRNSIQRMSERGIPMALDDFGTGYASLSHLRTLPISTLKIDRSFVSGMCRSTSDHAIVAAIVSMGRAMGVRVVAEGIENSIQERVLKELSCEYGQGFYFGGPVPSREVPDLIREWSTRNGYTGRDDILRRIQEEPSKRLYNTA